MQIGILIAALMLVGGAVAVSHPLGVSPSEEGERQELQAGIFSWWGNRSEAGREDTAVPTATTQLPKNVSDNNPPKQPPLVRGISGDQATLADIERQLTMAIKTGGISPYNYRSFDTKLKTLERRKVDTTKARALMARLEVGGQQRTSAAPSDTAVLVDIETCLPSRGICNVCVYPQS